MTGKSKRSMSKRKPVDPIFCGLFGLDAQTTIRQLRQNNPGMYTIYRDWHARRAEFRQIGDTTLPLDIRLAAYLKFVAEQPQRFQLGDDAFPSSKWLQEHLNIHRNTMRKYIVDVKTTGRVRLSVAVASQLAFAATIYPSVTRVEKRELDDSRVHRLDLIHDYHLTGRDKSLMLDSLLPITRTGKNNLFTVSKSYPCRYDLDVKGYPIKLSENHIVRDLAEENVRIPNARGVCIQ